MRNTDLAVTMAMMAAAGIASAQCSTYKPSRDNPDYPTSNQASVTLASFEGVTNKAEKDIVDTAVAAGNFTILATALTEAGLVDVLKGDGPFTVFAPTDEAFKKLPTGTLETLLMPENRATLVSILTYHVVAGEVLAEQAVTLDNATTVNGQRITIADKGDRVLVDNAKIIATNIEATNGVIHVIDTVILPSDQNIVEIAAANGSFGTLIAAAKAAGLVPALTGEGPITVFAPTDEAFEKLPAGTVENLLKPENVEQLKSILLYHVVEGRVYADQAIAAKKAPTLQGQNIKISQSYGKVKINDATVVAADLQASNGVIHVIDSVILPK